VRGRLAFGALITSATVSGCFDTTATPFPPGLEPLGEPTNLAAAWPAPVDGDPCPETMHVLARAPEVGRSRERRCTREAVSTRRSPRWSGARSENPQTGPRSQLDRHPPFIVLPEPSPDECDGRYLTQLHVDDVVDVDFRLCWRHEVVGGTDDAPLLTASRWQKVWGTTILTSLEGSLARAARTPTIPASRVLEYQYHLDALLDDPERIEAYLLAIYARLRDDAHGIPLLPADF
jgi:hypothetical protein